MGERKVLNKYIPSDFDPSLIPKGKKLSSKDGTVPVRMMLPFSIQCSTCRTFLYRGRKFNSKKEPMGGPDGKYLGITRFRFYIKCSSCARPITFLTDPQNADYEMESGGTRNYEVYKDKAKTEEEATALAEQEEKDDPMKALENRVLDSQREMADMDNLEEIKAMNARHVKLMSAAGDPAAFEAETKALLERREQQQLEASGQMSNKQQQQSIELTEEDEALIKSIKFSKETKTSSGTTTTTTRDNNTHNIKRLDDDEEERIDRERKLKTAQLEQQQRKLANQIQENKKKRASTLPIIKVKKRKKRVVEVTKEGADSSNNNKVPTAPAAASGGGGGLAGLLGGYSSSSDSD